jgi:hypothetical protein
MELKIRSLVRFKKPVKGLPVSEKMVGFRNQLVYPPPPHNRCK